MDNNSLFHVSEKRKQVWEIEMQILDAFVSICKTKGLSYYLIGGSLLGAVRHNGFIPWDDDIDIGMPRKDYDKFVKIANELLPDPLFLQSNETETGFYYGHAKIRNSQTTAIRKLDWGSGSLFNQGIFIDIMPFDAIPNNCFIRKTHYYIISFLRKLILRSCYYGGLDKHTVKNKIFHFFTKIVSLFISPHTLSILYDIIVKAFENRNTAYVGQISTSYDYVKSRRERTIYDELIDHQFEDRVYKIPKRYEEILNPAYGDWRTPKPQAPTLHGTTFFDPNHPYTYYLEGNGKVDFDIPL